MRRMELADIEGLLWFHKRDGTEKTEWRNVEKGSKIRTRWAAASKNIRSAEGKIKGSRICKGNARAD